MAELKFTKSELRLQQNKLNQLQKYLPTLQLKKAMLQSEVSETRSEILTLSEEYKILQRSLQSYSKLLSDSQSFDPVKAVKIEKISRRYENIAGVEVPYLEMLSFQEYHYSLFDTPPWVDSAILGLRKTRTANVKIDIAKEKKTALENELRDVSIRVNLFEKILIPRALRNIKKIKVFLGDQQLAAVSRAKVAKSKIEERKSTARLKILKLLKAAHEN